MDSLNGCAGRCAVRNCSRPARGLTIGTGICLRILSTKRRLNMRKYQGGKDERMEKI